MFKFMYFDHANALLSIYGLKVRTHKKYGQIHAHKLTKIWGKIVLEMGYFDLFSNFF